MAPEPILIIGAGLGGLALAQTLRRHSIPSRIFEGDAQHGAREQGWAISLHLWLMSDICKAMRYDQARLKAIAPTAALGLPSQGHWQTAGAKSCSNLENGLNSPL